MSGRFQQACIPESAKSSRQTFVAANNSRPVVFIQQLTLEHAHEPGRRKISASGHFTLETLA
jgi:hypothetical protein